VLREGKLGKITFDVDMDWEDVCARENSGRESFFGEFPFQSQSLEVVLKKRLLKVSIIEVSLRELSMKNLKTSENIKKLIENS
jgi:hypothetical protein